MHLKKIILCSHNNDMKTYINNSWQFINKFTKQFILSKSGDKNEKIVDIPHSVCETPFNYFNESIYEGVFGYKKSFKTLKDWKNRKVFLTFDGVAHEATVYLNGRLLGKHSSGYTSFSFDITEKLQPVGKENILCVKVDSRESLDIPPFGFVIDYMTYGGIYRDVYLEDKPNLFIEDVFVTTCDDECNLKIQLNQKVLSKTELSIKIFQWNSKDKKIIQEKTFIEENSSIIEKKIKVENVKKWSPENPSLYVLSVELKTGAFVDKKEIRFGFRDIKMTKDGFFLNGNRYKIRGLNRHQSFAYSGYAMPDSIQKYDAHILKYELGLNAVRTSHYPQSQSFIDACDELGLLVFTEVPGWQHIGQSVEWQNQVLENVKEMVFQYRNHPSIFLWGVRINESCDNDELYLKTNSLCHSLDFSRPTGGVRCIKKSHLLEDVYTYNEFVHTGCNEGCESKNKVTSDMNKPYLITEYCGHMFPTKAFDNELHRVSHSIRHAKILNDVASYDNICGSFGWCAFDYNTHEDFGSGDRICYHGVMDMFRNPKMASYVYKSQSDIEPVLEISSSMDVGEHPGCVRGKNWIFTNADSVKMYFNDIYIAEFFPKDSPFKSLIHPPILIDDYIGNRFIDEEKMNKSTSDDAKCMINFAALNGQVAFPLKQLLAGARLLLKGYSYSKLRKLYDDYVGNWGGAASCYKFEAIKDGKVVKTCVKGPVEKLHMDVSCSSKRLCQDKSWDASLVRISMKDQFGNIVPYYIESVEFLASGSIEIVGPKVSCFRGGVTGTYVRTNGKKGRGKLTIKSCDFFAELDFTTC